LNTITFISLEILVTGLSVKADKSDDVSAYNRGRQLSHCKTKL